MSAALAVLTLGSIWIRANTRLERYAAICHPRLVETYRSVGAVDVGPAYDEPGRADPRRMVVGAYEDAARLGARLCGIAPLPANDFADTRRSA
jgi:hypothetical protein